MWFEARAGRPLVFSLVPLPASCPRSSVLPPELRLRPLKYMPFQGLRPLPPTPKIVLRRPRPVGFLSEILSHASKIHFGGVGDPLDVDVDVNADVNVDVMLTLMPMLALMLMLVLMLMLMLLMLPLLKFMESNFSGQLEFLE